MRYFKWEHNIIPINNKTLIGKPISVLGGGAPERT